MRPAVRAALDLDRPHLAPYALSASLPLGEANVKVNLRIEDAALADLMAARLAAHAPVPGRPLAATASATLLSGAATRYDPSHGRDVRRAVNGQEVVAFGCTTMMEADLAMRSALATSLPERFEGMHGALLRLRNGTRTRTVALLGASGSGKSHIVARFLVDPTYEVGVLAEDWFVACAETGRAYWLPERLLLLKHETVAVYSGSKPAPHPSYADAADRDRALYDRDDLFGPGLDGVGEAVIDILVVLRSDESAGVIVRRLTPEDAGWIRDGEYSSYYQANEQLLDGSTEVFTPAQIDRRLVNLLRLSERTPSFVFAGSRVLDGHAALQALLSP